MKNQFFILLTFCLLFTNCKEPEENLIFDSITVHVEEIVFEDYGGWIYMSDDEGNVLGSHTILNNTTTILEYEQTPANSAIHLTFLQIPALIIMKT